MADFDNPLEPKDRPILEIPLVGSNEQVSIIIVHHERPEFLNVCLQSIRIMSNLNNYEIIVVDNASKDVQSVQFLEALEEEGVKVVRNKENLYWSAAANKGVSKADPNSKYFIFMHCDTVVLNQSWIDILINVACTNECGMVGTEMPKYTINKRPTGFVAEWCVLITKECWDDCGPWPDQLPIVGQSLVLTWRAQHKGYKPQTISNLIVHHYKAFAFKDAKEFNDAVVASYTIIPKLVQS